MLLPSLYSTCVLCYILTCYFLHYTVPVCVVLHPNMLLPPLYSTCVLCYILTCYFLRYTVPVCVVLHPNMLLPPLYSTCRQWSTGIEILSRPGPGRDDTHPGRDRDRDRDRYEIPAGTGISFIPAGTGIFPLIFTIC